MRTCCSAIDALARSDVNVLLHGESGTGKEVFAQAIHSASRRRKGPFVAVNCGAIPDSILESELFGYQAGAFTGARRQGKDGLFTQAHTGTIFLDEIGELPLQGQVKLLRVLQNGEYMKLGTSLPRRTDVRIIAATNEDLDRLIEKRMFRKDLYYRIRGAWLHLPPLRERRNDIPLLITELTKQSGTTTGRRAVDEGIGRQVPDRRAPRRDDPQGPIACDQAAPRVLEILLTCAIQ